MKVWVVGENVQKAIRFEDLNMGDVVLTKSGIHILKVDDGFVLLEHGIFWRNDQIVAMCEDIDRVLSKGTELRLVIE